ncbi:MAG: exo-alpha-sialidase [Sedimentisphaeraceae bacterium JB056]
MLFRSIAIILISFMSSGFATLYQWDQSTSNGLQTEGSVSVGSGSISFSNGGRITLDKNILYNDYSVNLDVVMGSTGSIVVRIGYDEYVFNKTTNLLRNRLNTGTYTFSNSPLNVDISSYLQVSQNTNIEISMTDNVISVVVDSTLLYTGECDRDVIGTVQVYSESANFQVENLMLDGTIRDMYEKVPVFELGTDGYSYYRIPAIVRCANGTLLAFAEGRVDGISDNGNVDIVLKRSYDDGATWSSLELIHDNGPYNASNPSPVVDKNTGRVYIIYTAYQTFGTGNYTIYKRYSDDNGESWSVAQAVSGLPTYWSACHPGPGHGVQILEGDHSGRLVVPVWHTTGTTTDTRVSYSSLIYSDDGGTSWVAGPDVLDYSDECLISAAGDELYMTIRPGPTRDNSEYRWAAKSYDGGESWTNATAQTRLESTICQGSTFYDSDYNALFISYPAAGTYNKDGLVSRAGLSLFVSRDKGNTWAMKQLVTAGLSAYSDLAKTYSGEIGVLFEVDNYSSISFTTVTYDCCMAFRYPSSKVN